ncbi:hypothetical protein [Nostoc sp.]
MVQQFSGGSESPTDSVRVGVRGACRRQASRREASRREALASQTLLRR